MRHVHWGLTARHGQVMVREFEQEQTRRLAIVIDTERDDGEAWTPLDRVCCVAASILTAASARGQGARIAAAVGDDVDLLARADEDAAMRWLALLEPSGMPLSAALGLLGPQALRGVATLVALAPAWPGRDLGGLAPALAATAADRVVVVVVRVDDRPIDTGGLTRAGIEVHTWSDGEDLGEVLGATP
jgi:uncharacterized protein (DUF58 family)